MKQHTGNVLTIGLSFLMIVSLYSCNGSKDPAGSGPGTDAQTQQQKEEDKYWEVVDRARAIKLKAAFRGILNIPDDDKLKTRAVWFDSSLIFRLYDTLKKNSTFDGIRVYFGAYPTNDGEVGAYYRGRMTLIIVPTFHNPEVANSRKSIASHSDTFHFKKGEEKGAIVIKGLNHGELCPDSCDRYEYPNVP